MKVFASTTFALVTLAAAHGAALAQSALVADRTAAHQKTQMCIGCHGIPGWRTAYPEVYSVPMIHGQHQAYIVKALQSYRSGERSHPSMRAIASSLSDQDIANLAAYYGADAAPGASSATPASASAATPTAATPTAATPTAASAARGAPATPVK